MSSHSARRLIAAVLFTSAISLFLKLPPWLGAPFGFLQAFYLPGLVFILFAGDRERSPLDDFYLPILISPILLSLLTIGFHGLTGSLGASLKLTMLLVYILLALAVVTGRFGRTGKDLPVPPSILLVSILFAGIVASAYIANRFLLSYTDAWYHTSVVNEIIDRGIPPLEPRLPDSPIRYMWIYHLFIAAWSRLSGLGTPGSLAVFNVVNAFAFPYLIARLTAFFTERRRYIVTSPLLAMAGLQSASWIFWPVMLLRALVGEVRGSEEIARILAGIRVNSSDVIHFLSPAYTWMVSLQDKFLTITPFNFSLNLFLLGFILALGRDFFARERLKAASFMLLVMLGAFLFHVITGTALILTAIGAGMLLALLKLLKKVNQPLTYSYTYIPAAAAVAGAIGLPYFLSLAGGSVGGGPARYLHPGFKNILTIGAPLVILFVPAKAVLERILKRESSEFLMLGAWIAGLLALNAFVDLPYRNESKLVFPFFLLVTPPLAWEIYGGLAKAGRLRLSLLSAALVLLFFVPAFMTVRGFILERPEAQVEVRRFAVTDEEGDAFEWIRDNTGIDAVIIENNTYALMPVHAHRRGFTIVPVAVEVLGYDAEKTARYARIRDSLFSGEPLEAGTLEFLEGMDMDIYLVVWKEDLEERPFMKEKLRAYPDLFSPVFGNPAGSVYRIGGKQS